MKKVTNLSPQELNIQLKGYTSKDILICKTQ